MSNLIEMTNSQSEVLESMNNKPDYIEFLSTVNFKLPETDINSKGILLKSGDSFYLASKKGFLTQAYEGVFKFKDYKILLFHNEMLNRNVYLVRIDNGENIKVEFSKGEQLLNFVNNFSTLYQEYTSLLEIKSLNEKLNKDLRIITENSDSTLQNINVIELNEENIVRILNKSIENSSKDINNNLYVLDNVYLIRNDNKIKVMLKKEYDILHLGYIPEPYSRILNNEWMSINGVNAFIDNFENGKHRILLNINID